MTVNPVGAVLLPLYEPLNPMLVEPPGARDPFQGAFLAVTVAPVWLHSALQPCVTFWSPGNVKPSCHDDHAVEPVFVTVIAAVKPEPQELAV